MANYLKPELLILIPLLIGLGQLLKKKFHVHGKYIPYCLLGVSFLIATVVGFILNSFTGWRLYLDAIVVCGLCHGAVAAFVAMGIYDTARTGSKEG